MAKWINCSELLNRWEIRDFELFDFLKKGLQAYTNHGKKIIDTDTLERARRDSIETIKENLRIARAKRRAEASWPM